MNQLISLRNSCVLALLCSIYIVHIVGCSNGMVKANGPFKSAGPAFQRQGLHYYLTKDLVEVKGTITYSAGKKILTLPSALKGSPKDTAFMEFVSTNGSVALKNIPDHNLYFTLDVEPGQTSEDELAVAITSRGILSSINLRSDGKGPEVIKNVTSFASTLAPILVGGVPLSSGIQLNKGPFDMMKGNFIDGGPDLSQVEVTDPLEGLSDVAKSFVIEKPRGKALWDQILNLDLSLSSLADQVKHGASQIFTLKKTEFATESKRQAALKAEISYFSDKRVSAQAAFDAALDQYKSERGYNAKQIVRDFEYVIDLDSLPSASVIYQGQSAHEVESILKSKPIALALFRDTKIVVAIDDEIGKDDIGEKPDGLRVANADTKARLFYRISSPRKLSTYILKSIADEGQRKLVSVLTHIDDKIVDVLSASSQVGYLEFPTNAFSRRQLAIQSDASGNITSLHRVSTSSAEGFTGGLATSATTAMDNLDASSAKVVSIQGNIRKARMNGLQTDLDRLTIEKQKLDLEIALQGENASKDLVLQKSVLDKQLAKNQADLALTQEQYQSSLDSVTSEKSLLDAKLSLASSSANFSTSLDQQKLQSQLSELQAQLAVNNANATASQSTALAELKGEVDLLKAQLDLLKTKKDIQGVTGP